MALTNVIPEHFFHLVYASCVYVLPNPRHPISIEFGINAHNWQFLREGLGDYKQQWTGHRLDQRHRNRPGHQRRNTWLKPYCALECGELPCHVLIKMMGV